MKTKCVKCNGSGTINLVLNGGLVGPRQCPYCKGAGYFEDSHDAALANVVTPVSVICGGCFQPADYCVCNETTELTIVPVMVDIPLSSVRVRVRAFNKADEFCEFPYEEFFDSEIEAHRLFRELLSKGEHKIITLRAMVVDAPAEII